MEGANLCKKRQLLHAIPMHFMVGDRSRVVLELSADHQSTEQFNASLWSYDDIW